MGLSFSQSIKVSLNLKNSLSFTFSDHSLALYQNQVRLFGDPREVVILNGYLEICFGLLRCQLEIFVLFGQLVMSFGDSQETENH